MPPTSMFARLPNSCLVMHSFANADPQLYGLGRHSCTEITPYVFQTNPSCS